jgi:hypothetical protein
MGGLDAGEAALDGGEQLLQGDGLFEELHRADAGGLDGGVDGAVAGHHHHRHGELAVGRPFLEQADAVGVGHPDVEQHEVGRAALRAARAAAAFSARMMSCPSSRRISERSSRMPTSSSTMRILAMGWDSGWGAAQADADSAPPVSRLARRISPSCSSMIF